MVHPLPIKESNFSQIELKNIFIQKCQVRQIEPDMAGLISENLREWNKDAWTNQLNPLMKNIPGFEEVWQEWVTTFHRILGENNSI